MNKQKLEEKILSFAVDNTKNPFPNAIRDGKGIILLGMDIFDKLEEVLVENSIDVPGKPKETETINASRASAFTASVVCQLYIADKIGKKIDKFAQDPNNAKYFDEFSNEQEKNSFISELKDKAAQRLSIDAKTDHGKELVQSLTDKFHDYVKPGSDFADAFLSAGLSAVITLNEKLTSMSYIDDSVEAAKAEQTLHDILPGADHSLENLIYDQILNNANYLAEEKGGMFADTNEYIIDMIPEKKAALNRFKKNYKSNSLTDEDKQWACDNFYCLDCNGIDEVVIDGKTAVSKEQIDEVDGKDLHAEIVGALLTGKKVTIKDYTFGTNSKVYLRELDGNDPLAGLRKTFWEKVTDFIKQMLGLDKATNLAKENQAENEKLREKMAFDELTGIKDIKKVKAPSAANKEHTAEITTPQLSAGR